MNIFAKKNIYASIIIIYFFIFPTLMLMGKQQPINTIMRITNFLVIFSILVNDAQDVPGEQPDESRTSRTLISFMTSTAANTAAVISSSSTSVPLLQRGCPLGEELRICSFCDGTCRFPVPFCGIFCSLVPRCFCQLGRLRNSRGQCIPSDQCFPRQMPPESFCCGAAGRCLHCAVGYSCMVHPQSGLPYCRPHWYGIGLMNYDDDDSDNH